MHCCCSVTQSCPTLCNPVDYSTPGFPVFHQLPELVQTHANGIGDAIQPSHPLSSPSPANHYQLLVQFSRSVMSNSSQRLGPQHTRPRCPSPTPGVYSNSCPLSRCFLIHKMGKTTYHFLISRNYCQACRQILVNFKVLYKHELLSCL